MWIFESCSGDLKRILLRSHQGYDVDLWPSCRFHLYAGALCMYACVVMERLFKGVHDEYQAEVYSENRCFFEEGTLGLLNDIFRKNANIAINAIEIDYEKIFKLGEHEFFIGATTLKRTDTYPKRATTCWGGCCREAPQHDRGMLLAHLPENPAFSRTVDLDSPTLIANDAVTPNSYELDYLKAFKMTNFSSTTPQARLCSSPRFPVREQVTPNQSPVHNSDDQKHDEGSYISERLERTSKCHGRTPQWLWSTLKFYATTKAKFFYHVAASHARHLLEKVTNPVIIAYAYIKAPSRPWGTLKQMRRHVHDQSDLEEIRKLVPKESKSEFRAKIKELIESTSQNDDASPEERIRHAQALFEKIFHILMECISEETGQIRTRANTAMEELQQLNESIYNSFPNLKHMDSDEKPYRPRFYHSDLRECSFPNSTNPLDPNRRSMHYSI
ncbi:hypothetical protein TELCIR_02297 [Teladorsagia circumcincta]|uniref:Uncharacterized protein n=1 Tax=Teladorsagia circumcincta TaxID=45464 RepID=A0A2G9UZG2_TELCI|nr:hypothetical protein TELCIR_02297 [Teladorsagia circumcincta]